MNKISKGNRLLFVTAFLFYGFSFLLSFAKRIPFPMIVQIFAQLLIVLPSVVYGAVRKVSIPQMVCMKKTRPVNFLMAFLVLLCSYPVIIVLNMISMFFVDNAVSDTMGIMLLRYGFWLPFFVVAVMPGFCEEFLFRGVVYGAYRRKHPLAGLFISAAAFGLMHGNFNQLPYAMFLGLVFVLMLEATDSIWVTMFMHFLLNGANVWLMYIQGPEVYTGGENASETVRQLFGYMVAENGANMFMIVMTIYVVMAVFFGAAAFALIYLTFYINHRSLKYVFSRKVYPDIPEKGNRIFDFWLLGFVIVMCLVMVFF